MIFENESEFIVRHFFSKEGEKINSYNDCYEILISPKNNSSHLIPIHKSTLESYIDDDVKIGDTIVRKTNYQIKR